MSIRARARMSHSFYPGESTDTILEEGESPDTSQVRDSRASRLYDPIQHDQQTELIAKLRQRIVDLETEAETTASLGELQRVQQEWQTSEDLLRGSQRDNEQKHETIEQHKVYVKDLKRIIEETLGPNWEADHQVRPPLSQSVCFSASTPLPKPSASTLRRSVTILPSTKRSSKVITRHASISALGNFNPHGVLPVGIKDEMEMDDTPTGAMRKLMGSSTRSLSTATRPMEKSAKSAGLHNLGVGLNSPSKERSISSSQDCSAASQLDNGQVNSLLTTLSSMVENQARVPDEKVLLQALIRIEKVERMAEARESRLKVMLEETRV